MMYRLRLRGRKRCAAIVSTCDMSNVPASNYILQPGLAPYSCQEYGRASEESNVSTPSLRRQAQQ
eukprot:12412008-Karenia_brevis.AAC.1